MMRSHYGLIGTLILILDIWAIINVMSAAITLTAKFLWTLLILFFPVGGVVIWFLAGPQGT